MIKAALVLIALFAIALPAQAAQNKDQQNARAQMRDEKVLKLRDIEAKVLPQMKGTEYLGPEYDSEAKVYRLKFIDNGRVIFVDVDARSGDILSKR